MRTGGIWITRLMGRICICNTKSFSLKKQSEEVSFSVIHKTPFLVTERLLVFLMQFNQLNKRQACDGLICNNMGVFVRYG